MKINTSDFSTEIKVQRDFVVNAVRKDFGNCGVETVVTIRLGGNDYKYNTRGLTGQTITIISDDMGDDIRSLRDALTKILELGGG